MGADPQQSHLKNYMTKYDAVITVILLFRTDVEHEMMALH
jgi:hypothetical protein